MCRLLVQGSYSSESWLGWIALEQLCVNKFPAHSNYAVTQVSATGFEPRTVGYQRSALPLRKHATNLQTRQIDSVWSFVNENGAWIVWFSCYLLNLAKDLYPVSKTTVLWLCFVSKQFMTISRSVSVAAGHTPFAGLADPTIILSKIANLLMVAIK